MTPEELEELRALVGRLNCTAYDENLAAILGAALEHIDQQAASLAATEERVREHEAHENQTHEVLGKILGTDDTLENVARRAVNRIAELERQIIQQTGISASRMEERERLQKQIAALQEIAIGERERRHISDMSRFGFVLDSDASPDPRKLAADQLAKEYPEAFR